MALYCDADFDGIVCADGFWRSIDGRMRDLLFEKGRRKDLVLVLASHRRICGRAGNAGASACIGSLVLRRNGDNFPYRSGLAHKTCVSVQSAFHQAASSSF